MAAEGTGPQSLTATSAPDAGAALHQFESAWNAGGRPSIEDYLGALPEADRETVFISLLALELTIRRARGENPTVHEYRQRFATNARLIDRVFEPTCADTEGTSGRQSPFLPSVAAPFHRAIAGYEILGDLGHGGMGNVYRAYDRKRGEIVALKTLQRADAASIVRFKHEFRALADISHPNLVSLYELNSAGDTWFFTMELVEGVNFLEYSRAWSEPAESESNGNLTLPGTDALAEQTQDETVDYENAPTIAADEPAGVEQANAADASPPGGAQAERLLQSEGLARLRRALLQLAEGVACLHGAGKLHRDIKPSNVLVTRRGRVVLLDFGLAAELSASGMHQSTDSHILGTAAYMAPEQAAALPVSAASDWYSVGVTLYEALTGRLPFMGRPLEVLMDKQRFEPPAPREVVVDVPEDLNALCVDLLRRDPKARPTGRDVLRRLGAVESAAAAAAPSTSYSRRSTPLIGRDSHIAMLEAACLDMKRGSTIAVFVSGRSGTGKSTLVQRFLDDLRDRDETVVLAGRCFEREEVPYKALDSVIDALSRHLRRLQSHDAQALLPRDIQQLARVFPALRHVESVAASPRRAIDIADPQELRRRAFSALRELLARLGDRGPLVVTIDDLQWGDLDSAALLSDLLRPPDPPVLLLVGCYRGEDAANSPFLQELGKLRHSLGETLDIRDIAVEPLTTGDAETLAQSLIAHEGHGSSEAVSAIARESGGNPFFIAELVRHVQSTESHDNGASLEGGVALDKVLWSRVLRLPEEPRRLLEIVAVSGRPLGWMEARRAADLGADGRAALAILRSGKLVRGTGLAEQDEVETYHDRIRESIIANLDPEALVRHHHRLATTLDETGRADPEVLAVHYLGARDFAGASRYFTVAADRASETMAFDQAAKLYRLSLEHGSDSAEDRGPLRVKLGDALANAGRGAEAAAEYLSAGTGKNVATALELKRRAAMQFLVSGHVDEGLATLRTVLASVGMNLPATSRSALWSLLLGRLKLHMRGLNFRQRDESQVSAEDLVRIDVCWSAVAGLSLVDPLRGADFQTRSLLLALHAGEPYRLTRAFAIEAAHLSSSGSSTAQRVAKLLQSAEGLSGQVEHPYAGAIVSFATGMVAFLQGKLRRAVEWCDRAETVLREHCTGVSWELDTVHTISLFSLGQMGEVAELARRWPALLQEARERNDRYAVTYFNSFPMTVVRLAAGEPDRAECDLRESIASWTQEGFHVQHLDALASQTQIHLYRGEGTLAWECISSQWRAYQGSLLGRVQKLRVDQLHNHGRCAVAAAALASHPEPLLRIAERDAAQLARERMPLAPALAAIIRAGIASVRNDQKVVELLRAACTRCEQADLLLFSASARRHLGVALGGDEGRTLVAHADAWMQSQGIQNPERTSAIYVPGFLD